MVYYLRLNFFFLLDLGGKDEELFVIYEWMGVMGYFCDFNVWVGEVFFYRGIWVCVGYIGYGMLFVVFFVRVVVV